MAELAIFGSFGERDLGRQLRLNPKRLRAWQDATPEGWPGALQS